MMVSLNNSYGTWLEIVILSLSLASSLLVFIITLLRPGGTNLRVRAVLVSLVVRIGTFSFSMRDTLGV